MLAHSRWSPVGIPKLHTAPSRQRACKRLVLRHADAAFSGAFPGDAPEEQSGEVKVLPRLREKDPHRVLGIPQDSDFEEVQDARNFLIQEFQAHEASREHIEMAYERIVSSSFKNRRKQGFRPGRGKRGQKVAFEAAPTLGERIKGAVDPSATLVQLINEAVIFGILGIWSAMTIPQNNLPTMLTFAYSVWKILSKRNMRNPEGPFFGGSPIWGALLVGIVGMALSLFLSQVLQQYFPFWRFGINESRAAPFFVSLFMCPITVYLK